MLGIKQGFTLIELLIASAIIAILATVVIPAVNRRRSGYQREQFITEINDLLTFAYQNALREHSIQKVLFDFNAHTIHLESATEKSSIAQNMKFEPVKRAYKATNIVIPATIEIRNFIIEGVDEVNRLSGKTTAQSWFYVMPDGVSQEVIINFVDTSHIYEGEPRQGGLVLNPFLAQFEVYDEFQE